MKYKDKISVIIPTYNRAYCILKSINSVLEQTYDNIEVIIVDDGSTDNTKDVIKKINNKLVKYYSYKKNKGSSYARNYGIKKATGKYIAFQDSDDIFNNEKLEKQYNNMLKNKSDLDFCKIEVNIENGNKIYFPNVNQEKSINNKEIAYELCNGNFISTQAILIKTEIMKNNLFDEMIPALVDYDLVLRLCTKYKISYTNEVLVYLYRQENSISNSFEKRRAAIKRMLYKKYDFKEKDFYRLIDIFNVWYNEDINSLKNDQINALNNKVDNMNNEIIDLNNQISNLNNEINNNNIEIDNLSKEVNDKNEIILNKDKELEKIRNKFDNQINEHKLLIDNYNKVINSKGWKFLEKLRKLKK